MSVQWFPGHMTKAIRQIEQRIKEVDMVIECRDARIPYSSSNPVIDSMIQNKPRLIVLTKRDLARDEVTLEWQQQLEKEATHVVLLNVLKDNVVRKIEQGCQRAMKEKHERDLRRGIKPRIIRALILGVPNVGKSTLMNQLSKKRVAEVSNRPGVTRALKKVKISNTLEVVDSPGLLWPKFEYQEMGYHLALCLSVKETGFHIEEVVKYGLTRLSEFYLDKMIDYYQVSDLFDLEILFKAASQKRGQPLSSGAQIVFNDIVNHRFGKMSWESYEFVRTKFSRSE